ncbi:MAG TPA: hypothetical protein VMI54_17385, partial [Polyangiaceae bacterium]|nr:hypothetical protein [Polyangiaceae bacterium]
MIGRARALACLLFVLAWCLAAPLRAEVFDAHDLSTPRRAMATFVDAANRGDWPGALLVLDVRPSASAERKGRATELAQELDYVLARSLSFQLDAISDDPKGTPEDGADTETVATVR